MKKKIIFISISVLILAAAAICYAWLSTDPPYVLFTTPSGVGMYRSDTQQLITAGYCYTAEASGFQNGILSYCRDENVNNEPDEGYQWITIITFTDEKGEGGTPQTFTHWDVRRLIADLSKTESAHRAGKYTLRLVGTGNNGFSATDYQSITIRKAQSPNW